jgi:hypothetical protein
MVSREFPDWHAEDQVIASSFIANLSLFFLDLVERKHAR